MEAAPDKWIFNPPLELTRYCSAITPPLPPNASFLTTVMCPPRSDESSTSRQSQSMRATRALTRETAGGCPAGCGRARGSVRSSLSNGKVTSMSPAWTCTPRVLGSSLVSTCVQLLYVMPTDSSGSL